MTLFVTDSNNVFGKYVEEAGQYNVKVLPSSAVANSQNTGNPMLTLNYEVIDGKYKGATISYHYLVWDTSDQSHEEMTIKRFNTFTAAMGVPDGTKIDSLQQLLTAAIGHTLSVEVEWQQHGNGKWYLDVQRQAKVLEGGSQPNGKRRPDSNETDTSLSNSSFQNQQTSSTSSPNTQQNTAPDLNNVPF